MANGDPPSISSNERAQAQPITPALDDAELAELVGDQDYGEAFGENLAQTLDLDTWATGLDWEGAIARLKTEIRSAVEREEALRRLVRDELLPRIGTLPTAPKEAGVYRTTPDELTKVHEGLLFPGHVEAIDGTLASHETLPLGITQIGVALVSYGGMSATFAQRVFRKEFAGKGADPVKAVLDIIDKRDSRSGLGRTDGLSELAHRGIMTYAERNILVDKATSEWRIGHGAPIPYELLTGSGSMRLLEASLGILRRMIQRGHFVFVTSGPNERGLLTIGNALAAGEYAIIDTIESQMERIVDTGHYAGTYKDKAMKFVKECGPQVMRGLYCASEQSPAYLFYAPAAVAQLHVAARVAIADSILRPARGFPMLIDVADATCRSAFGSASFVGLIHDAYAQAGVPMKYFGERDTRR